jgi:transcriptional regulator with XRE-family HTH domain
VGELELGQRIKEKRLSRQLTLKQLAEMVGCSDAHISQIERGRASPSISTLKKIAASLQSKITDFFNDAEDDEPVVMTPENRKTLTLSRWNARIQSLVKNAKDKRMQPFFTTIQPGGGSHGSYQHVGEEFGIVLKGELSLEIKGTQYTVHPFESFYYDSTDPHSWSNDTDGETIVIWVVSPPSF